MMQHNPSDELGQAHVLGGLRLRVVDSTVRLPPKASLRAVWLSKIICECGHEALFLEDAEAHWRDAHPVTPRPWWRFWAREA